MQQRKGKDFNMYSRINRTRAGYCFGNFIHVFPGRRTGTGQSDFPAGRDGNSEKFERSNGKCVERSAAGSVLLILKSALDLMNFHIVYLMDGIFSNHYHMQPI